jgi:putative intracellular protease/amidase
MWDLINNPDSTAQIESFYHSAPPVVAICHSPVVVTSRYYKGQSMAKGRRVTEVTSSQGEAV